jgi:hypothetical protein
MRFGNKPRIYHKDGKAYPSVTSILSALEKNALLQWAANCAVDYLEGVNYGMHVWGASHKDFARTAYKRESMEAADYGTYIHTLAEYYFKTGIEIDLPAICPRCRREFRGKRPEGCCYQINGAGPMIPTKLCEPHEQTNKLMKSFYKWVKKHNVKPIETEVVVFGENYAGRVDLICEMDAFWEKPKSKKDQKKFIARRVVVLIDLKTGKGSYYPSWYLQTAGYRDAWNMKASHFKMILPLVRHHGVLKFNKQTCRVNYKDMTPTYERDLKAFKLLAEFYNLFVEVEK